VWVITTGLPGTGKSVLARAIARAWGLEVLRSDVIRKELAGLAPGQRAGAEIDQGLYTPERTRATYAAMLERAVRCTRAGRPGAPAQHAGVVLDANFPTRALRAAAVAAGRGAGARVLIVEVAAPESVVHARLVERAASGLDASDAGPAVYQAAKARFEPSRPEEADAWLRVDGSRPADDHLGPALAALG
jgi:predicted kinase